MLPSSLPADRRVGHGRALIQQRRDHYVTISRFVLAGTVLKCLIFKDGA